MNQNNTYEDFCNLTYNNFTPFYIKTHLWYSFGSTFNNSSDSSLFSIIIMSSSNFLIQLRLCYVFGGHVYPLMHIYSWGCNDRFQWNGWWCVIFLKLYMLIFYTICTCTHFDPTINFSVRNMKYYRSYDIYFTNSLLASTGVNISI